MGLVKHDQCPSIEYHDESFLLLFTIGAGLGT
jgi:hypothetical protein